MFRRIDRSKFLIRSLEFVSTALAKERGTPILIGIILIAGGMIIRLFNVGLDSTTLQFFGILFHDLGIILALVGLLLSEPLGR